MFDNLSEQQVECSCTIDIVSGIHKGVESRKAVVEMRYCEVWALPGMELPGFVRLNDVEVREGNVASGISPVCWHLLNTHPVATCQQAVSIVGKYRLRWYIEQWFRLLNKKDFRIESSELERGMVYS